MEKVNKEHTTTFDILVIEGMIQKLQTIKKVCENTELNTKQFPELISIEFGIDTLLEELEDRQLSNNQNI